MRIVKEFTLALKDRISTDRQFNSELFTDYRHLRRSENSGWSAPRKWCQVI
jgi:hypothetical protein